MKQLKAVIFVDLMSYEWKIIIKRNTDLDMLIFFKKSVLFFNMLIFESFLIYWHMLHFSCFAKLKGKDAFLKNQLITMEIFKDVVFLRKILSTDCISFLCWFFPPFIIILMT